MTVDELRGRHVVCSLYGDIGRSEEEGNGLWLIRSSERGLVGE